MQPQPNIPHNGITLQAIVEQLLEHYGWEGLSEQLNIRCFQENPSVKSSLTFLRKTDWARQQVEELYVWTFKK